MSAKQAGKGVWLELRIHGVHGTPPHSMLGVAADKVGQVAGDGITGIWRTKDGKVPLRDLARTPSTDPPYAVVEAYSWGGLTSRVKGVFSWLTRVLWMFLLPFALMNLAYWARPELDIREPRTSDDQAPQQGLRAKVKAKVPMRNYQSTVTHTRTLPRAQRSSATALVKTSVYSARVVRIAAAGLTVFLILTPLTVGVDLLAWQCYREGAAGCPSLPGFFDFFTNDYFSSSPQRRLVVGSVPALLVILLLWQLSRQSLSRYESATTTPVKLDDALGRTTQAGPVLLDATLWSGTSRTQRLRRLHLTLCLCVVVCYTAIPVLGATYVDGAEEMSLIDARSWFVWVDGALTLAAAVVGLVVVFVLLPRVRPGDLESNDLLLSPQELVKQGKVNVRLVGAIAVLTGVHLLLLLVGPTGLTLKVDQPALLGENVWFIGVFLLFAATAVMLSLIGRVGRGLSTVGGAMTVLLLGAGSHWWWREHALFGWDPVAATSVCVLLCVTAVCVLLGSPNKRRHGKDPMQLAWGGAGPLVLAVAAIWIGLLFTTAATTYAANFLNGDQSVADLGTSGEQVARSIEATADADDSARSTTDGEAATQTPTFVAAGDVAVHDAVIQVDYELAADGSLASETIHVHSGTISVGSYRASVDRDGVLLGATEVRGVTLVMPEDAERLDYEHSCVVRTDVVASGECSLESGDGRDGSLAAPDILTLGEAGGAAVAIRPTEVPQATLLLPQVLVWAPLGQLVVFAALAALALVFSRYLKRHDTAVRGMVRGDRLIAEADQKACVKARNRALLPHRAETCVGWLGVPTLFVSLGIILGAETGNAPWTVWPSASGALQFMSSVGLWVALGSAVGLVWLASKLRSSGEAARGVGILWDLTTFWPRAAHPLAPPCYAERVVPEVITRITWALEPPQDAQPEWGGAAGVIVSAHSQGSTIAAAALSRLTSKQLMRVRLVTYGSQLRTWYGRVFPGVFGPTSVGYVRTEGPTRLGNSLPDARPSLDSGGPLPQSRVRGSLLRRLEPADSDELRWVNLFRRTDPIGFRVFSDDDHSDRDHAVREVPTFPLGDPGPQVMAHSGYQHTPEYLEVVAAWTGETLRTPTDPPVKEPPFLPSP